MVATILLRVQAIIAVIVGAQGVVEAMASVQAIPPMQEVEEQTPQVPK